MKQQRGRVTSRGHADAHGPKSGHEGVQSASAWLASLACAVSNGGGAGSIEPQAGRGMALAACQGAELGLRTRLPDARPKPLVSAAPVALSGLGRFRPRSAVLCGVCPLSGAIAGSGRWPRRLTRSINGNCSKPRGILRKAARVVSEIGNGVVGDLRVRAAAGNQGAEGSEAIDGLASCRCRPHGGSVAGGGSRLGPRPGRQ